MSLSETGRKSQAHMASEFSREDNIINERKFMQALDDEVYGFLQRVATARGVTIQCLIRAIVIPEWVRAHLPNPGFVLENRPMQTHSSSIVEVEENACYWGSQVLRGKNRHH